MATMRLIAMFLVLTPLSGCDTARSVWSGIAEWGVAISPFHKSAPNVVYTPTTDEPVQMAMAEPPAAAPAAMAPEPPKPAAAMPPEPQPEMTGELARLEREAKALEARIKELRAQAAGAAKPAPMAKAAPAASGQNVFAEAFAVHLASYRKVPDAVHGWGILTKTMAEPLKGLEPRLLNVDFNDGRGAFIRLKAGPLASRDEAVKRCADIKAAGGYCQVETFSGEPFPNAKAG